MAITRGMVRPVSWSTRTRSHQRLWYVAPLTVIIAAAAVLEMHLADLGHGTHLLVLLVVVVGSGLVFGPGPSGLGLALSGSVTTASSVLLTEPLLHLHDAVLQLSAFLVIGASFIVLSLVARSSPPGARGVLTTPVGSGNAPAVVLPARSIPEIPESLTAREHEVLCLAASGMSTDEMAEHLCVSPNTVKTHLTRVYGKLDAHGRTDAVRIALHSGWLSPTDICPHRFEANEIPESPIPVTTVHRCR